jgi:integrase
MPQRSKGARLWLQPANGREPAVWVIRDGKLKRRTGFRTHEAGKAEQALASYIAVKYRAPRTRLDPGEINVADVIAIYADDVATAHARPGETAARLKRLLDHFGTMTLADINRSACNRYAALRGKRPAARRDLADLRAAIRHHWAEGYCSSLTPVILPPKTTVARDRWLSRKEAADLLRAAWRYREIQKGQSTGRHSLRHVARFALIGLYTGTRAGAICGAALDQAIGRGWVDLEQGIFYRRRTGSKETKKRQPPIRIPPRLLAHMRRWRRNGLSASAVIEWNGSPVKKINKAFRSACDIAGLGRDVVPHTLRHTCATWLAQHGVPVHEICGFLGMTQEMFDRVYGHHHPDHQSLAVHALGGHGRGSTALK